MEKLKKSKLYLMCGIAGAGKSTWIANHKQFFDGTVNVVSRDAIRFSLLKEGEDYFSKEKQCWAEYVAQAKKSILENDNTILDATHLNVFSRGRILHQLKDVLKDVSVNAIVIDVDAETAIKQNSSREGRAFVPPTAIREMKKDFVIPTLDEEFDKIYIYKDGKCTVKERMN